MTETLGIIAEYNPLHNGHIYQLNESKKISRAEFCVVVMSGNFTQRGEISMLSKWERAKIAVDCGVDLVLELPFVYACNNAEYFAKGAVQILDGISCVDTISFGSESGDINKLQNAADAILHESDEFKRVMTESLAKGNSYPKARAEAVKLTMGKEEAEMLSQPNNILAVEYLKELSLLKSKIVLMTIERKGQGDNSTILADDFASATGIRKSLETTGDIGNISKYVPEPCLSGIKSANLKNGFSSNKTDNMFMLIRAKILSENEQNLEDIFSAGEGLGFKLKKEIRTAQSLDDLIMKVKSKRYTRTRIQRLLMHTLFDLKLGDVKDIVSKKLNYTRVLAFNEKGATLLKKIKKSEPKIPIITNINKQVYGDDKIMKLLRYDILASDLYNLISNHDIHKNSDFVVPPIKL